jgi:hypothetical protein
MRVQRASSSGGEVLAGEDHHRHLGDLGVVAHLLQHLEAGHVGQAQVEHHAVEAAARSSFASASSPGAGGGDLDVVVPSSSVTLSARPRCPRREAGACGAAVIGLQPRQCGAEALGRGRLAS